MRPIGVVCVSLGFAFFAALSSPPAKAAACADLFPFVCLFGPEAEAMRPAEPVAEAILVAVQQPRPAPRRRVSTHKPPAAFAVQAKETTVAPAEKREPEAQTEAGTDLAQFLLGPGPALAMSLRLAPTMHEQISPPNSACVVEQTFNELFALSPQPDTTAERAALDPRPLLVAIKTGAPETLTDIAP